MPAPVVTPHRVGKNAVVTIDGTTARQASGTVNRGGGADTQVYPDGYPRHAATDLAASGDLTILVDFGSSLSLAEQTYINLTVSDGTNSIYDGVAYVNRITDSFANDGGWTYSFEWSSHGDFSGA